LEGKKGRRKTQSVTRVCRRWQDRERVAEKERRTESLNWGGDQNRHPWATMTNVSRRWRERETERARARARGGGDQSRLFRVIILIGSARVARMCGTSRMMSRHMTSRYTMSRHVMSCSTPAPPYGENERENVRGYEREEKTEASLLLITLLRVA